MVGHLLGCEMPLTLTARFRDLFSMKWIRPVSDHEAGQVLARRAAEAKAPAALTLQERKDAMTRQLEAERAAGWPGAAVTR